MQNKQKKRAGKLSGVMFPALKGAVCALIITIIAILIFAAIIKQTGIENEMISAINQIIKLLAAVFAGFIASKKCASQILAGGLSGLMYVLLGYIIFSLVEGTMGSTTMLAVDAVSAVVMGAISAYIFTRLHLPTLKRKTAS